MSPFQTKTKPGLPDFSWYKMPKRRKNIPNHHTIYQMATKIPNGRKIGRPNGHKMYTHLPLQDPRKFSQIGIFGLKLYHLATLNQTLTQQPLTLCYVRSYSMTQNTANSRVFIYVWVVFTGKKH
jgi:hypothetical protein